MADHPGGSEVSNNRREREFRRYAEAVLGIRASEHGETAVSSTDVPLTAFAQLVALRLNAKRVLVSLFDQTSQYILAEATQTLSLQRDQDHGDKDAMFFGTTVLPRSDDWHSETLRIAHKTSCIKENADIETAVVILPDLLADERYSKHQYVVGAPFIRSYIGVPLMAPTGYAVGTLTLLDDKPRVDAITTVDIKVMRDVSASIMTHIELARNQTVHIRGLRMVQGLSRFIEGKGSLDNHSADVRESLDQLLQKQNVKSGTLGRSARTQAMDTASNAERDNDMRETLFGISMSQASDVLLRARPDRRAKPSLAIRTKLPSDTAITPQAPKEIQNGSSFAVAGQLQEDAVSKDVMQAFGRAAHLIQSAMTMAGVLFLDASAGTFGSFKAPVAGNTSATGSESASLGTASGTEQERSTAKRNELRIKPCRYLGTAYASDADGHPIIDHNDISEKFLHSLLKRFPYGKIYNFGEDGLLPSSGDELSDSAYNDSGSVEPVDGNGDATTPRQRRARKRYSDSLKLQRIFPGLRSFAMVPMWNEQKGRFLAGAIAWSYNPARLFSLRGDLNYVSAFCDVLMAEVGRIDVQADVRAKANFISSVSHELRSPLHGILGSIDFLQEEENDEASRQQMIQMIDTCGRSLLDIVNNLLEYAQASSVGKTKILGESRKPWAARSKTRAEPGHDLAVLAEEVLDSMLWDTPLASTRPAGTGAQNNAAYEDPLKIILDLDHRNLPPSGWSFHVNAGGFRRILQNLTGNAIKYTDTGGFFKCRMSMDKATVRTRPSCVQIECSDNGRGMSESYLKTSLWQAFEQEDSNAHGTGLGLSLVKILVEDMGGSIHVSSTQGVGTSFKITLPLTPAITRIENNLLSTTDAKQIEGLVYSLVGFDTPTGQSSRSSESINMMRTSLEKVCQYLLLRSGEEHSNPHVYLVSERQALAAPGSRAPAQEKCRAHPCVVVCDSVASSRRAAVAIAHSMTQATVISQPVGPRKMLKAIISCLTKLPDEIRTKMERTRAETTAAFDVSDRPTNKKTDTTCVLVEPVSSEPSGSMPTTEDLPPQKTPDALRRRPSLHPRKSSILLVDDNPVNLVLLQKYMKKLKRHHIGAKNGLEAVERYHAAHSPAPDNEHLSAAHVPPSPDAAASLQRSTSPGPTSPGPVSVIFMDITMPVMDGLESTRRIRALERTLGLKPAIIVVLTAQASPQARQDAYGSGIDLFLTKPVRFKDIEQMFKTWEEDLGGIEGSETNSE